MKFKIEICRIESNPRGYEVTYRAEAEGHVVVSAACVSSWAKGLDLQEAHVVQAVIEHAREAIRPLVHPFPGLVGRVLEVSL